MISAGVPRFNPSPVTAWEDEILLKALVAGYALMAHADGEVTNAERRRFFAMIRETPAFEGFPQDEIIEDVAGQEADFRRDLKQAQRSAWHRLAPVAGQRRAAHVLISACRELIPADGVAHPAEYSMLSAIQSRLGIDGLPPHA